MALTIALIGAGFMGGSIARAIRFYSPGSVINAYDIEPAETCMAAADGLFTTAGGMENLRLSSADFIIIAAPPRATISISKTICARSDIGDQTLIIDVCSIKKAILDNIRGLAHESRFVGCHPMAGSEKSGLENAAPDLFQGATVIITPQAANSAATVEQVSRFWSGLAARPLLMPAELHDRIVACTSHLPHLGAAALVTALSTVAEREAIDASDVQGCIAGAFTDMTRIAASHSRMWHDIVMLNKNNVVEALTLQIDALCELREWISSCANDCRELDGFLEHARCFRSTLSV